MKKRRPGKILKIALSILLIAVSLGISAYSSSIKYTDTNNDGRIQQQLTRKLAQVGAVWVTVKVVSGVISVVKTVQVEGSIPVVGGLAVSAQPLGWADVINETLNHISNICLWAMGAIAIQKMLLTISAWVSLRIIVPVCAILIVLAMWNKRFTGQLKRIIAGVVMICAGICFAVPLSLELSNAVEASILSNQISKTVNEINGQSEEIEKEGDEINSSSFIDRLVRMGAGIAGFFGSLKQKIDSFIDNIINYVMWFIVTNILIPIGTVVGLKYLVGAALKSIGFSVPLKMEMRKKTENSPAELEYRGQQKADY